MKRKREEKRGRYASRPSNRAHYPSKRFLTLLFTACSMDNGRRILLL
jgi:hypothetical protein